MPNWISEGSVRKYHRALAQLAKENSIRRAGNLPEVAITEDAIKALYVKWGGLVIGDESTVRGVEDSSDVFENVTSANEAIAAEVETAKGKSPKGKRGKK